MTTDAVVTTLKTPRQIFVRKALIIGAAAAGIIIAGAVAFAVASSQDEETEESDVTND